MALPYEPCASAHNAIASGGNRTSPTIACTWTSQNPERKRRPLSPWSRKENILTSEIGVEKCEIYGGDINIRANGVLVAWFNEDGELVRPRLSGNEQHASGLAFTSKGRIRTSKEAQ